jgi:hypothetical protein
MVRREYCAEPSFAARLDASKLGIAIAATIPIIAIVIKSSINEKPAVVTPGLSPLNCFMQLGVVFIDLPVSDPAFALAKEMLLTSYLQPVCHMSFLETDKKCKVN